MKTSLPRWIAHLTLLAACVNGAWASDAASAANETKAVTFSGHYLNFTESNPRSGSNPNSWGNTGQLEVGADFDMDKLTGWSGATVRLRESFFLLKRNAVLNSGDGSGHFWAQDTGSTLGGAPFPNFIPTSYLSELTLEQRISDKLTIEVGRMNPMMRFDTPSNCENILSCQNPVNLYDNLTLPPAFATWGALGRYQLNKNSYAQVGAHEDNFASGRTTGLDWSTDHCSGLFMIGEYGYRKDFGETAYPWNITGGVWHDTSDFTDPASGSIHQGADGAYMRAQKVAWRADSGATTAKAGQYITSFATAGYSPSAAQSYRGYTEVGANYHGLFTSRPNDYYGVKLAYLRINDNQLESERQTRLALSGIDYRSSNNQYRLEVNGHIDIKQGVFLEPVVQYIKNANVQFGRASGIPKDGVNLGLVLFVSLPSLF